MKSDPMCRECGKGVEIEHERVQGLSFVVTASLKFTRQTNKVYIKLETYRMAQKSRVKVYGSVRAKLAT